MFNAKHQFCCGKKNCPEISKESDGSVVISDDSANVATLTTAARADITFTREQAFELGAYLKQHGYVL